MKITVEETDRKFTLEIPDDLDVYEMADEMKILMYAMTYAHVSILEVIPED